MFVPNTQNHVGIYNMHLPQKKDENIPYMCERCGQYFDWLGILTKLVKKCPECGREIGIQDPINFCNQHGDKRVPMHIREVRM